MRLARPFYKLALQVNLERLRSEIAALPADAWVAHPNKIDGNTSVRLISSGGAENDDVHGPMAPTPHLKQMPYVRQLLADFGVVWSRSRLMQLAPRAQVPEHADINFHWFNRVRIHIPVITNPQVRFHCGDQSVHMGEGEVWLFDNWRLHRVENQSDQARIHLVADTTGSSSFWRYVADSMRPDAPARQHLFNSDKDAQVLTERQAPWPVLHPAEIELVTQDLRREFIPSVEDAAARERTIALGLLLEEFTQDWRQVYSIHGPDRSGWTTYLSLRDGLRKSCEPLLGGIVARTNRIDALTVLEGRLLRSVLHLPAEADPSRGVAREP